MVNCSAKGGKILRNHWYKEPQGWYKSDAILINYKKCLKENIAFNIIYIKV